MLCYVQMIYARKGKAQLSAAQRSSRRHLLIQLLMQIKPSLRIKKSPDPKGRDNTTHAQQRSTNPVTADTADALFGRHGLGPVVQVQTEEMDGCADELDGGGDGELGDEDLEVFLGGDGVWDCGGEHGGEGEGAKDGEAVAEEEGGVCGEGDAGAADGAGGFGEGGVCFG